VDGIAKLGMTEIEIAKKKKRKWELGGSLQLLQHLLTLRDRERRTQVHPRTHKKPKRVREEKRPTEPLILKLSRLKEREGTAE